MISKRILVCYDDYGKPIRKRFTGETEIEVEKQIAVFRAEQERCANPTNVMFRKYSEKWLKDFKSNREFNTRQMYEYAFRHCSSLACIPIKNIKRIDIQRIINENWEHPATCKKIALCLKAMFRSAIEDGIIYKNPVTNLSMPESVKKNRMVINDKIIDGFKKLDLPPMEDIYVKVFYYFGLRPQEALALMRKDFDFVNNTLTISRAVYYEGNNSKIKATKTANVRTLPIPDALICDLRDYLSSTHNLYLFTMQSGELLTKSSERKMWARIVKQLNIALGGNDKLNLLHGFTKYTFRRSYATRLYYSGISLKKAAELMGHSDTKMITEVYAQIQDEQEPMDALKKMCM